MTVDAPRFNGWSPLRTATHQEARRREEARRRYEAQEPTWRPCGACWGQKWALEKEEDGTWTVLRCGECLGVGEVLR